GSQRSSTEKATTSGIRATGSRATTRPCSSKMPDFIRQPNPLSRGLGSDRLKYSSGPRTIEIISGPAQENPGRAAKCGIRTTSGRCRYRAAPARPPHSLAAPPGSVDTVGMEERCGICDRLVVKIGDRWFHADTTPEDHSAVWLNEDHPADPWIESSRGLS